nr:hypothetical protein [Tanacetum cinerariifolium]
MKYEYLHDDRDAIVDYLWERDFSIYRDVYPIWCLEFFLTMYFDRGVDRTKLMTEKCIWFRLCGVEKGINLDWVIAEHLCKHAPGLKEKSIIYGGKDKNLDSSWGDWNASLNKIKRRDVWRDLMLMRNNYILEHSAPILHHLADQSNFSYPAYEPLNVPPYHYPCVPYPHPYTYYPNMGSPSFRGDHYGAHGNSYHAGSIVPSSGYRIGGSSTRFHRDEFDLIMHSEDCVESDDDEMRD